MSRSAALLAAVVACLIPSAARADTAVTGAALPDEDPTVAQVHFREAPSCADGSEYGVEWQRTSGGTVQRVSFRPPGAAQVWDGPLGIGGLEPGAVYRYRGFGASRCADGTWTPRAYGEYRCLKAGRPQADATLNVPCSAADDPGVAPPVEPAPAHMDPAARRCPASGRPRLPRVLRITSDGVRCGAIRRLLAHPATARRIGRRAVFHAGEFVCRAIERTARRASYHCAAAGRGWWMRTRASGSWHVREPPAGEAG